MLRHVLVFVSTSEFQTGGQVTNVKQDFLCTFFVYTKGLFLCNRKVPGCSEKPRKICGQTPKPIL